MTVKPDSNSSAEPTKTEFERAAGEKPPSLLTQLYMLLRENKKWWLVPIVAVFLIFGLLLLLSGTVAAPFIYTLF